jgi:hypothetical protein
MHGVSSILAFLSDAPRRLEDLAVRLEAAAADQTVKQIERDIPHSTLILVGAGFILALLVIGVVRWLF